MSDPITVTVKEITDLPGYYISPTGEVWKQLKPQKNRSGHLHIYASVLDKPINGRKRQNVGVHRVVAKEWIGPPPFPGAVVRHKDHDPENNDYTNLRWGRPRDNVQDMVEAGRHSRGSRHPSSKLTPEKVNIIRESAAVGLPIQMLADEFRVSKATISRIVNRRAWKDVI